MTRLLMCRFVEGYRQQPGGGGGGGGAELRNAPGADVQHKYDRMYEERINPFNEFKGQQVWACGCG